MFKHRALGNLVIGLILLGSTLTPASDLAFTHVNNGDPAPRMKLGRVGGGLEGYLGKEAENFSVFAFVKSGNPRSAHVIDQWGRMKNDFSDQPVNWALIISDRHETGDAALWDSLAPGSTVLIDSGDQLYSQLGVVLTPSVGIADKEGLLRAYIPFRQINYPVVIEAHLKFVMGQISREELDKLLNPSGHTSDSLQAGAKRKLKLGKMLLKRGRLDAALSQTEKALAECPDLADGYRLLAEIHQTAGRTKEAATAESMANTLSPALTDSTVNPKIRK